MVLDRKEITTIFNETYPSLCRFLESLLGKNGSAQEVAQDSFLRLCRTELGRIPASEARFWLFRVARNLALDKLRQEQTKTKFWNIATDIFRARVTSEKSPYDAIEQSEMQKAVRDLLKLLPEHQRSALLLREQEEMSYREIAVVLNVSEAKVKIDIFRARTFLRTEWQKRNIPTKE